MGTSQAPPVTTNVAFYLNCYKNPSDISKDRSMSLQR